MKATAHLLIIASISAVIFLVGSHLYFQSDSRASWESRKEVVRRYLNDDLTPSDSGLIVLPPDLAKETWKHVFVTERGENRFVLFVTWVGKGGNMEGYLFSTDTSLRVGENVLINRPSPRGVVEDQLPMVESLGGGWYRVLDNLD